MQFSLRSVKLLLFKQIVIHTDLLCFKVEIKKINTIPIHDLAVFD